MLGRGHSPTPGRQEVIVVLGFGVEGCAGNPYRSGRRSELSELNGAGPRAAASPFLQPERELAQEGGGLQASSEAGELNKGASRLRIRTVIVTFGGVSAPATK